MFRLFVWLLCKVGCVERENRTVFFAVRITGEKNASGREARRIAEAILNELKI